MVDLSFFSALVSPPGLIALIALVIAAAAFTGYLTALRTAALRRTQIDLLSRSLEQLSRLVVLEYSGVSRLGQSLARALNPTGEPDMLSPEAKAAVQALGPEPERVLEEVETVLSQAGKALGWRYVPGARER